MPIAWWLQQAQPLTLHCGWNCTDGLRLLIRASLSASCFLVISLALAVSGMPNSGHAAVPSSDTRLTPIVLEDLNGDGKLDVVTGDEDADAVAVRLGYGD